MQITNAMKMVSTAKLNRAQNAVRAAQPYAEQLRHMVTTMAAGLSREDHPLLKPSEGGKPVVMLYTSDRGLCGAFNAQLNKALYRALAHESMKGAELVVFGRQGNEFFRRRGVPIRKAITHAVEVEKAAALRETIRELQGEFVEGKVSKVFLAYNRFKSAIGQEPRVVQLLPIEPPIEDEEERDTREVLFEPSRGEVLDMLLPNYLDNQCFLAHLNTEAGEHGARMVAMDGATRNAKEMINRLTLQMNKARQAAITKELIEIVNGAQAL
jgi:F-type H+-transporting ATPase subunit gamma